MDPVFIGALVAVAVASFALSPRTVDIDGFFRGWSAAGRPPGLLALTFSQVTTWIFARSLLTAAILGFHYGIAGGLAYAAYYFSFLTGAEIIRAIRFRHGHDSVQDFLHVRFGGAGVWCYNVVVGVRLLSEVFANLLVVGIIFGQAGSTLYIAAIVVVALVTLGYSMLGGLRASIRTDVVQMGAFLAVFAVVLAILFGAESWSLPAVLRSSPPALDNGWNLLLVAGLQIWSYPLHDPVMMDRGFVADRRTTLASFRHAAWISMVCILGFSLLGVFAGLNAGPGEAMQAALTRLLGPTAMTFVSLALIISAASTLDSTLSSASKLAVADMRLAPRTVANGRIAMAAFTVGGLAFLFGGSQDLYAAVAVSGTASMYLAPVIFFAIWGGVERIPRPAYYLSFATALAAAALYWLEAGGTVNVVGALTGIEHKYTKLLLLSGTVMVLGNAYFALGMLARRAGATTPPAS